MDESDRYALALMLGWNYCALGQFRRALEVFRFAGGPGGEPYRIRALFTLGRIAEARQRLKKLESLASKGETSAGPRPGDRLSKLRLRLPAVQAEARLSEGKPVAAIGLLERVRSTMKTMDTAWYFFASETLARAWEDAGHPERALRILEEVAEEPGLTHPFFYFSSTWLEPRRRDLYAQLGDRAAADEVQARLDRILEYADPGAEDLFAPRGGSTASRLQ